MTDRNEKIYDSPPSEPGDSFWLEHGHKMLDGSLDAVRSASKSLMTGLGLLQGIYLAILGFAHPTPESTGASTDYAMKFAFVIPLVLWAVALYFCIEVMMTRSVNINVHSPDDIRSSYRETLKQKQGNLRSAFWLLAVGLIAAILLITLDAHR